MFGAIALAALWRPLGLIHFLVCTTTVRRWSSRKVRKHVKTNGLGRFRGTHFGGLSSAKSVPMQRGTRFQVFQAFPCNVALVFRLPDFSKRYKHVGFVA